MPILNLSQDQDTHQTLSSTSGGVKAGSRAEMRAHFQAGLFEAPAPSPQVFLTLPQRFVASSNSVYAAPPQLCPPPLLPLSGPPTTPSSPPCQTLLPVTKTLTAPTKDFQENLPTDSQGGRELRASHSNVPPEFICLCIPLTNFVLWGQRLDPFGPQFGPL